MPADELDRILRDARPHTAADDGWAQSADGGRALAAVHAASPATATNGARRTLRRIRPFGLGIGFAAVAASVVGIGVAMPSASHHRAPSFAAPPSDGGTRPDSLGAGPAPPGPGRHQTLPGEAQ